MGGLFAKPRDYIDAETTCAEMLGVEGNLKAGGFAGYNFVIDNQRPIDAIYIIGDKLGQGSYAAVYNGMNRSTEKKHAIKAVSKKYMQHIVRIEKEISCMKRLDHPNLMRCFETFENDDYIYMVLELMEGGDLYDRILKLRRFNEVQCATAMEGILRAFTYMHSEGICHRDCKPENFMFREQNLPVEFSTIKVIDFGFAAAAEEDTKFQTKCGTPYYVSPQILAGDYSRKTDMWSIGCIMYAMLCGYPPFYGGDVAEVLSKIQMGRFEFNDGDWRSIDDSAKDLIKKLVMIHEGTRLTPQQAFDHEFIQNFSQKPKWINMKLQMIDNIRNFNKFNALKKAALQVIATFIDMKLIKEQKDIFQLMDSSGDGQVSEEEFATHLQKSNQIVPNDLGDLLRDMDSDGNGEISFTEYLAATIEKKEYSDEEMCWAAFRVFDRNGDGLLGRAEVSEVLTLGQMEDEDEREAFIDLVMEDIDEDNSGAIDFHEFLNIMRSDMPGKANSVRAIDTGGAKGKAAKKTGLAGFAAIGNKIKILSKFGLFGKGGGD